MSSVGTGKTHLATAIALKACQESRTVRFYTAAALGNILQEKNNKGILNNFLGTLKKVELIVVDEIGFVPLHKDAAELLFQVISDCYERKSQPSQSICRQRSPCRKCARKCEHWGSEKRTKM